MALAIKNQYLNESVDAMLCGNDELVCSFYGIIVKNIFFRTNFNSDYCYFGLTKTDLLIAYCSMFNTREITGSERIPLDFKKVKVKKSMVGGYLVKLYLHDGSVRRIQVQKKMLFSDLVHQTSAVETFVSLMNTYSNK